MVPLGHGLDPLHVVELRLPGPDLDLARFQGLLETLPGVEMPQQLLRFDNKVTTIGCPGCR